MSGGGDNVYSRYAQPENNFSSSYNPAPPPFSPPRMDNTRSLGPYGFDLNTTYASSTSASAHGGMAGPSHGCAGYGAPMSASTPQGGMAGASHGYSGYGVPLGFQQMSYHAGGMQMPPPGGMQMPQPPRHSTSSISGFARGPFAPLPPNQVPPMLPNYGTYGDGGSHGGPVHMSHASPSWHPSTMRDEEMSSAAPRRRRGPRTQVMQQAGFLDAEVGSSEHSMPSVGEANNITSESSSGDNAEFVGDDAAVEDEGTEGSMGGQDEGSSSDGDFDWLSDDDSSDECYKELYKALDDAFGDEEPVIVQQIKELGENSRTSLRLLKKAVVRGMYEDSMTIHVREIKETGAEFVERTLRSPRQCYNMFRMRAHVFEALHEELRTKYGLKAKRKCSSREALAIFLYMVGPPQAVRQADSRFERSMGTISRKFNHVLSCLTKLAKDIIAPKDRTFTSVHPKVANHRAAPFFNNAIGALDGTHVKVVAPFEKVGQYINRKSDKTQNVLAICDFDRRFTFVAAGVPGSAHDWTVLQAAMNKYESDFPHPPPGKFYLVDAGYPNRPGYLSPYKGFKYHQQQWRRGPVPSGEKELFNKAHSSLRSVIEQSFGMLKMKWRILLAIPSYREGIRIDIILACCALHNDIIEHDDDDMDLAISMVLGNCGLGDIDADEAEPSREADEADDDINMNVVRDEIAHAYYMSQQR